MLRILISVSVLCLTTGIAGAQTGNLLITEYLEGSGNNKALEIFNGTEDLINLGSYSIERYSNGETTGVSIPLDSVDLLAGKTWVIAHPQSEAALLALADQTDGDLNFNGNDALVLVFAGTQVVDSFGRVGEDPGEFWSCPEGNTQNHTLRRSQFCLQRGYGHRRRFRPLRPVERFPQRRVHRPGISYRRLRRRGQQPAPLGFSESQFPVTTLTDPGKPSAFRRAVFL